MDSRIREALEKIANECDIGEHTDIAREALSLLTAEPEPCENIGAVLEQLHHIEKEIDFCDGGNPFIFHKRQIDAQHKKAEVIDAYATLREQEAREDERRRFEPVTGKLDDALGAEDWHEVKSAWCDLDAIINPDQSAILQGTEPAKVSEDVEKDVSTIIRPIKRYQEYWHGHAEDREHEAEMAIEDVDSLVSRLKEDR